MSWQDEQEEAQKRIEEREEKEKLPKAYYSAFHSAEGQIVLNDLLNQFYRGTSLDEEASPNKVLVKEGSRYTIIYILSQLEKISKKAED